MNEPVLSARGVVKRYMSGERVLDVLEGLDIEVAAGESVAIVGDSGVGKSTLLHVLGGLDLPDEGTVAFLGREMVTPRGGDLSEYRNRHVGFIFQFHHLLPEFTALENVEMPFRIGRRPGDPSGPAREMLMRLGLADRLTHRPGALSGGEQQRVAIARAIINEPTIIFADEPTGNLDAKTGEGIVELLLGFVREKGTTLVVVTHDANLAQRGDRRLEIRDGLLVA